MTGTRILVLAAAALLACSCGEPEPAPAPAAEEAKAPESDPSSGAGMDLSASPTPAPAPEAPPAEGTPGEPAAPAEGAGEMPAEAAPPAAKEPGEERPAGPPPPTSPEEISETEVLMSWSKEEQEALDELTPEDRAGEIRKRRLHLFQERGGVLDPDAPTGSIAERPADPETGERGPARPEAVKEKDLPPPELREILLDLASSDAELRARGADSATRFPDRAVATKHVLPLLEDRDPDLRAIAASTLGALGQPESVAPLAQIVRKGDKDQVRAMALRALGDIGGPKGREALRALVKDSYESSDRSSAFAMLIRMKEAGDVKDLIPVALDDIDAAMRMQGVMAIREFKLQAFEQHLMPRLEDFDEQVIQEAMRALAALGSRPAVPALVRILLKPGAEAEDPEALQAVANMALETITGVSQGYNPEYPDDLRAGAIDQWRLWWEKNRETWK